jgi:dihydroxyacetone kinase
MSRGGLGGRFFKTQDTAVEDNVLGLVSVTPHLNRLDGFPSIKVVYDEEHDGDARVAVVAGGGSGHEPSFAGMVGEGMLAAAVAGDVFAAPPEEAVFAAIRRVCGAAGCCIVIMNYTGDVLNFGAAAKKARAQGLCVELVIVADDCALESEKLHELYSGEREKPSGRRGIAGTLLVLKTAGAAAAQGMSLEEVKRVAETTSNAVRSMGCAFVEREEERKHTDKGMNKVELEFGLGIHGEPGAWRGPAVPVDQVVDVLLSRILVNRVNEPQRVVVLINNLGGTTQLEMGGIVNAVLDGLESPKRKCSVIRAWVGTLMTSLDMHGFSISVLFLPPGLSSEEQLLIKLLDDRTSAPAWPAATRNTRPCLTKTPGRLEPVVEGMTREKSVKDNRKIKKAGKEIRIKRDIVEACIRAACSALIADAADLDRLDARVGDGDCGTTHARGAQALLTALPNVLPHHPESDAYVSPSTVAKAVADVLGRSMGGSSGALYTIFFSAAADAAGMVTEESARGVDARVEDVAAMLRAGMEGVMHWGGAAPGDRTMIDALYPAVVALEEFNTIEDMSHRAMEGAEQTAEMRPGAGRSRYVPEDAWRGVPDPGAMAVATWLGAVASAVASMGGVVD